jgi:hypothetical protein
LDRIGAGYFSTLGIPIRVGREIQENDRGDGPKVCIINEAFANRFFDQRNPIGMRITAIDEGKPTIYHVVGVAADARTQSCAATSNPATSSRHSKTRRPSRVQPS